MVGHIVKPVNLLNVSAYDSFLFVEHTNSSIDFDIHVLMVFEILQGNWNFIFSLLVKNDFQGPCVVIDREKSTHWLVGAFSHSSDDDYVCDILSLDFKNIIWSWCSFINHLHCDRRENTVLALPTAHLNLILLCMHAFSSS